LNLVNVVWSNVFTIVFALLVVSGWRDGEVIWPL